MYFSTMRDSKVFVIVHTTNNYFHGCSEQAAIAQNCFQVEKIIGQARSKATHCLPIFS